MSRIAKKPINFPDTVSIEKDIHSYVITGNLGKNIVPRFKHLDIKLEDNTLIVLTSKDSSDVNQKSGLFRSLISNAIVGVTTGFKKTLILKGLGFKAALQNDLLTLSLGFSHKVNHIINKDISCKLEKDTIIYLSGVCKAAVSQEAALIRSYKSPDSYHAKGILYQGEVPIIKEGKKK